MGIFGFFNKKSDSNAMPIGAALDMLEGACRAYPQLVLEWIDANPSRAQRINGLVDNAMCRRFKGWDGPYSITYKVGERRGQVVNMFFQNLSRDVKRLCEMVAEAGHKEDEERLGNDKHLIEDLGLLQILSSMAVSGKALDLFPSLLNTESQYDSKSIVLVGMVHYYAFVHSLLGNNAYMTLELFKVVDKMRERERGLNKKDFVLLNFIELADNLFANLDRYPKSLEERTHDLGTEMYKLYAFNIAGWVYFTLTKGKSVDVERDKYVLYLTNLMISEVAWGMCGVEHNVNVCDGRQSVSRSKDASSRINCDVKITSRQSDHSECAIENSIPNQICKLMIDASRSFLSGADNSIDKGLLNRLIEGGECWDAFMGGIFYVVERTLWRGFGKNVYRSFQETIDPVFKIRVGDLAYQHSVVIEKMFKDYDDKQNVEISGSYLIPRCMLVESYLYDQVLRKRVEEDVFAVFRYAYEDMMEKLYGEIYEVLEHAGMLRDKSDSVLQNKAQDSKSHSDQPPSLFDDLDLFATSEEAEKIGPKSLGAANAVADQIVDAADAFSGETICNAKVKLSEHLGLQTSLVVAATLLYSISRRLEIEFPEVWTKYGEKWLDDVLHGIEEVHPLIGFEYKKLMAQYDANVEKELTTWMGEAYPNSDERSVDGMKTVECGFFWMHYRLYKDIDRKEIDDISSPYISMSFSLYEKTKSILGLA